MVAIPPVTVMTSEAKANAPHPGYAAYFIVVLLVAREWITTNTMRWGIVWGPSARASQRVSLCRVNQKSSTGRADNQLEAPFSALISKEMRKRMEKLGGLVRIVLSLCLVSLSFVCVLYVS